MQGSKFWAQSKAWRFSQCHLARWIMLNAALIGIPSLAMALGKNALKASPDDVAHHDPKKCVGEDFSRALSESAARAVA